MSYYYIPGATAVGITFDGGVLLAAEKRVSYGNFVFSKAGKKVFKITDYVGAACAGMVGDMQVLVREVSAHMKIRELEIRTSASPRSVAKLMSVFMFGTRYAPLLTQVILGGVDTEQTVYVLDPLGSVIPDRYASVGTGAEVAIGILEFDYVPKMKEEQARALAIKAIRSAVQRDAASGDGTDLLIITPKGIKEESVRF